MNVGTKIATLRKARKLSQADLAQNLGIGQTALCDIESGKTKKIDFLLMDKVCKEFDVDFQHFINDKQVNKVKENNGAVGCNNSTINLCPDNIIDQVKNLVEENAFQKQALEEKDSVIVEQNKIITELNKKLKP